MNILPLEPLSTMFQAMGSTPRLQILLAIGEADPCVCHLETAFHWRQAYLSQLLSALRKAGILVSSRQGRNIHYRLADPRLLSLIRQAAELQGVSLPEPAPSSNCTCPNCKKEKKTV
jgi:DNA-binding transcriptional ArsR family regulator